MHPTPNATGRPQAEPTALAAPGTRAVFIDKDGTLVENVPYNVDPAKVRFTPHALEGLGLLAQAGYKLIVVTNQPGIALGQFDRAALKHLQSALTAMMKAEGVVLDDFFACPHAPATSPGGVPQCLCRKPAPGLLRQAAGKHRIDLAESWMVGDILDDVEAGQRAGCRTVLLDVGNETIWRMSPLRTPHVRAHDLRDAAQQILAHDAERARLRDAAAAQSAGTPSRPSSWVERSRLAARALAARWRFDGDTPARHLPLSTKTLHTEVLR
jgi:histidinol-phosphate phosphatase family protein